MPTPLLNLQIPFKNEERINVIYTVVCVCVCVCVYIYIYIYIYRVSQEERTKLREGVPYVKLYRYNPKHLCPKLNSY